MNLVGVSATIFFFRLVIYYKDCSLKKQYLNFVGPSERYSHYITPFFLVFKDSSVANFDRLFTILSATFTTASDACCMLLARGGVIKYVHDLLGLPCLTNIWGSLCCLGERQGTTSLPCTCLALLV